MRGIAKVLLKTASVIALLCAGLLLLPSPASAQFGFPGIQFRVPYIGGGHYRGRHHKSHESRRRSHGDPEDTEPAEHAAQGNGKSAPQQLSAPVKDTPSPQPAGAAAPPKPVGEEPAFSPSR